MNSIGYPLPIMVPEGYKPGEIWLAYISPGNLGIMYTGGDFYEKMEARGLGFEFSPFCPACLSTSAFEISEHEERISVVPKGWSPFPKYLWKSCSECDLVFSAWMPSRRLLTFLYQNAYPPQSKGAERFITCFDFDGKELDGTILEIGGGDGAISSMCSGLYSNLDIETNSDIPVNVEDALEDPAVVNVLEDMNADVVICCDLIEHLRRPSSVFEVASLALKLGGSFYLNVGQYHTPGSQCKFHPPHLMSFSKMTLECLAKRNDFNIAWESGASFIFTKGE